MSCHSPELHILANHDVVEFKTFFYFRILNAYKDMDNLKLMAEALLAMKTLNSEKKVGSCIFPHNLYYIRSGVGRGRDRK